MMTTTTKNVQANLQGHHNPRALWCHLAGEERGYPVVEEVPCDASDDRDHICSRHGSTWAEVADTLGRRGPWVEGCAECDTHKAQSVVAGRVTMWPLHDPSSGCQCGGPSGRTHCTCRACF
jgi:hypothetical protein